MRHEIKYLVSERDRSRLQRYVARHTDRDAHANSEGVYTVRSIYLDTSRGAMYETKLEGVRKRLKVRVRGYNDVDLSSTVTLELKEKHGSVSRKRRARTTLQEAIRWLGEGPNGMPFAESDFEAARRFRYFTRRHALKPVVLVAYEREPFVGLHDPTLRVTFDRSLRGRFTSRLDRLGAEAPAYVYDRHFILEVKFDYHYPTWLKPALAELGVQKKALSKYVLTVDACARATHGRRASFSGGRVLRPGLIQSTY